MNRLSKLLGFLVAARAAIRAACEAAGSRLPPAPESEFDPRKRVVPSNRRAEAVVADPAAASRAVRVRLHRRIRRARRRHAAAGRRDRRGSVPARGSRDRRRQAGRSAGDGGRGSRSAARRAGDRDGRGGDRGRAERDLPSRAADRRGRGGRGGARHRGGDAARVAWANAERAAPDAVGARDPPGRRPGTTVSGRRHPDRVRSTRRFPSTRTPRRSEPACSS